MRLDTFLRRLAVFGAALLLAGCMRQELYGQVSERQANEMVALLQGAGIDARKEHRDAANFAITSPSADFGRAIELLHANGYPRGNFDSVGQVFKKEGFVSSPVEERARLTYALSQELANTLQTIDGVVVARVHLAVPEKDPLTDKPHPASASVFIKHRAGRDLTGQVNQMKALVVNGVEGLPYDNVTVALFPAETVPAPRPGLATDPLSTSLQAVAGFGGLLLLGSAGVWGWRRRQAGRGEALVLVQNDRGGVDAARG
ncbi:type III secretion system inner membrane ring lipoprotein SctJ [Piscinibacter gummiphilus]|uniref:type III secretion system inner membrane ring lipoprotein SctJ n=1 Tax=Piscinibacter gummiphilus TaxID=946333 RepID=UPI000A2672B9|nr:type III secretion inner membrane ring lipoprotein SctJ [Piscinibacter gummiphilus]ATU68245.1 EscJ/YscJ/HrcJ family type III secretion inner membrane ring protein [Piscinibacter gummiphilus]GLS97571.1 EscJ/YscJ/HrcJ family type III secretion inner membrane ring protein [Piscinibacter gummiphilus]